MANLEAKLNGATGDSAVEEGKNDAWRNITLSYTRTYSPRWKPRHALRELIQNWKDGLVDRFELDEKHLPVTIGDSEAGYTAKVHDARGKLLGFVKYLTEEGTVELANFGVSLGPEVLDTGYTTKQQTRKLAGGHGEGLKMAALVMLREGYRFHIQSSEHNWNFNFGGKDNKKIICSFSWRTGQADEGYKEKNRRKFDKKSGSEELKANIWEDISVKIGGNFRGKGSKIDYATFRSWLDVSVDLDRPSDVTPTGSGDLIMDRKYGDMIYLKGLRLEANPSLTKFKFGYNLFAGDTNRDRQGMIDMRQQAKIITRIWEEPIVNGDVDILDKYIEMLRAEQSWADVTLAEEFISRDMASRIWEKLQRDDPEHKKFYYDQEKGERDVEIIRRCLKKQPVPLPRRIWKPLYELPQVRTPYEQQCYLLKRCSPFFVENTPYNLGIRRAMRAVLFLDIRTKDLTISFKKGNTAGLNLLLDGSELLIHERWLDFYKCHDGVSCPLTETPSTMDFNKELFSCDHVVIEWYGFVLNELLNRAGPNRIELEEVTRSLHVKVSENLRNMPTRVEVAQGDEPQEIRVSWVDSAGVRAFELHRLDLECRITLHLDNITCQKRKTDLLAPEGIFSNGIRLSENGSHGTAACGCPEGIVSQMKGEARFYNLDVEEAYFPMVVSLSPKAFYSLPPDAVRPKQIESDSGYSYSRFTSPSREVRPDPGKCDSSVDTHSASSDTEDDRDVETPQTPPSPQGPGGKTIPIRPLASAPSIGTPTRFSMHSNKVSHMPHQASQRENGQEVARLQAVIKTRSEQVNIVRKRVRALFRKVQTNIQLRNLPVNLGANHHKPLGNARRANSPRADFGIEDPQPQSSERVTIENEQSLTEIDILNRRHHQMGPDSQSQGCKNHRGGPQNADNECQDCRAQTQEPLRPNEVLQGRTGTRAADPALEFRGPENAQSEIEALRKLIQELEEEKATLVAEVERLQHEIRALKTDNEKLKADFKRPNTGLAAELQDILNLLADHESDVQLPDMGETTVSAEAEESTYPAGHKRGGLEEEGESSQRSAKRLKQVEVVDIDDSASY